MFAANAKPFKKVKNTRDLFYQLYKRGFAEALTPDSVEPGSGRCLWKDRHCQCENDVLKGNEYCHYHLHLGDIGRRAKALLWAFTQPPLSQIQEVVMGSTPRERTDFLASCLFVDPTVPVPVVEESEEDEVIVLDP